MKQSNFHPILATTKNLLSPIFIITTLKFELNSVVKIHVCKIWEAGITTFAMHTTPDLTSCSQDQEVFFTFRIGTERSTFRIEKQIISHASPVLDRMMNNGMKESAENIADLPEVDQLTFLCFIHHVQSLWWTANGPTVKRSRLHLENGPLVARLLDHHFTHFECLKCSLDSPLAYARSFPHCENCRGFSAYMDECDTFCVIDSDHERLKYRVNTFRYA